MGASGCHTLEGCGLACGTSALLACVSGGCLRGVAPIFTSATVWLSVGACIVVCPWLRLGPSRLSCCSSLSFTGPEPDSAGGARLRFALPARWSRWASVGASHCWARQSESFRFRRLSGSKGPLALGAAGQHVAPGAEMRQGPPGRRAWRAEFMLGRFAARACLCGPLPGFLGLVKGAVGARPWGCLIVSICVLVQVVCWFEICCGRRTSGLPHWFDSSVGLIGVMVRGF